MKNLVVRIAHRKKSRFNPNPKINRKRLRRQRRNKLVRKKKRTLKEMKRSRRQAKKYFRVSS